MYASIKVYFYNSMRELEHKQKVKQRLYSTPVLSVILILTLFLIKGTYQVMQKDRMSVASVQELKLKAAALSSRQTELDQSINRLNTGEGVDEEIKDKFSVSKPGEHVAVIVDPKDQSTTTSTSSDPWYNRLWKNITNL
jgi:cell division protein FtsB